MQQLLPKILGSAICALGFYGVLKLANFLHRELTSSVRLLPGPPSTSWIYGNLKEISNLEDSRLHEEWGRVYRHTTQYKGILGMVRMCTTDPKAVNHILMHPDIYQKPAATRHALASILGEGSLLVVEGGKHKTQNPAFGLIQTRYLTEIFIEKAIELRDVWAFQIGESGSAQIDALSWMSRTALDVIGLAGFNYMLSLLQNFFPPLRLIETKTSRDRQAAREVMSRIGSELLASSKAGIARAEKDDLDNGLQSRSLLSLLVKANMSASVPGRQKMSDEDVIDQVATFIAAGHETTGTGTAWALFALTQNPRVQAQLREELLTVLTDIPSMEELSALPYLDAVIRETMRLYAPLPSTTRVAHADDVLPLSTPLTDSKGNVRRSIVFKKGQWVSIPVLAMNRSKSIWGEDAWEFKPERWHSLPDAAHDIPGIWGNTLAFMGGPRACIGWRFAVTEMKALLFTLVRSFELELAVPPEEIVGKLSAVVYRPMVKSNREAGNALPLIVKPFPRG
ncbi:cytochrome P450 [Pleurotus eryngii]|uniref:Cytochrome P450 n=1 Tax=Pleurotus eryngii TaxID=5323 RepID=A0A9P6AA56_PLEER|nr:cytochrome P450 [Pleurotus eryngii]